MKTSSSATPPHDRWIIRGRYPALLGRPKSLTPSRSIDAPAPVVAAPDEAPRPEASRKEDDSLLSLVRRW